VNNVAAVVGAANRRQSSLSDSGNVPGGPEIVVALTAVTVASGTGG
jgi:hypothetical protein